MVQLIWTELAQLDLDEIFRYYDAFSRKIVISYLEEIIKAGDLLESFPEMGPRERIESYFILNSNKPPAMMSLWVSL